MLKNSQTIHGSWSKRIKEGKKNNLMNKTINTKTVIMYVRTRDGHGKVLFNKNQIPTLSKNLEILL